MVEKALPKEGTIRRTVYDAVKAGKNVYQIAEEHRLNRRQVSLAWSELASAGWVEPSKLKDTDDYRLGMSESRGRVTTDCISFFKRGALIEDVVMLTGYNPSQVTTSRNTARGLIPKLTDDEVRIEKSLAHLGKPRLQRGRVYSADQQRMFVFVRTLFRAGFLSPTVEQWQELNDLYQKYHRELPSDFASRVRLEIFATARKHAKNGNEQMLRDYRTVGREIDSEWFLSSLRDEERFVTGHIKSSPKAEESVPTFSGKWQNKAWRREQIEAFTASVANPDRTQKARPKRSSEFRFSMPFREILRARNIEIDSILQKARRGDYDKNSILFTMLLLERGFLTRDLVYWDRLRDVYRVFGRDLPEDHLGRLRLEVYLAAILYAINKNDTRAIYIYERLGTRVDEQWFRSNLEDHERFIRAAVGFSPTLNGAGEDGEDVPGVRR